jgi:hypothetical protein
MTATSELPGGVPPVVKDEDIITTPAGDGDASFAPSAASASASARNP